MEWRPDEAPRERPETYPGAWPGTSILLAGDRHFRLQLRKGRRLGQARVLVREGVPGHVGVPQSELPLGDVLIRYNVARVDDCVPVLAIGSNASPAQLRHKYRDTGIPVVMPLVKARVEGLAPGVAPIVTSSGYVPATPILGPDLVDELFVQWLDTYQLSLLDETEQGYERLLFPAGDPAAGGVRITLPSGEILGGCYVYVSTAGCLSDPPGVTGWKAAGPRLDDGSTLTLLPRQGPRLPGGQPGHDRQTALVDTLLEGSASLRALMGDSTTWFTRTREPGVTDRVREIFQEAGWVRRQDSVVDRAAYRDPSLPPLPYGQILPAQEPPPGTWRVVPSADGIDRQGEAVVRIIPPIDREIGEPQHVAVSSAMELPTDGECLDAIARVLVDEDAAAPFTGHHSTDDAASRAVAACTTAPNRIVEMDEVLRWGLGVEIGEEIRMAGVRVHHWRWLNYLIGRPFHVTCRVQLADPATIEHEVCLLDPLSLDLLGIQSGAEVIIEGRPDDRGEARRIRVKALAAGEAVRLRREVISGGDFRSRFPSARDALGLPQEIPWVYIDRAMRTALGLGSQRLATVRVRASRSFQLRQELREMLVVLSLAFIGLIELLTQTWARIGVLLAMVVLVVTAVSVRMRGRLTRRLVRPHRQRRRARHHRY